MESTTGRADTSSSSSTTIDYLEVSSADAAPLSVSQIQTYFSRFGALLWCLQAGSESAVIFKFVDDSLVQLALGFNHSVDGRPLTLQAMKNGGLPVGMPSVAVREAEVGGGARMNLFAGGSMGLPTSAAAIPAPLVPAAIPPAPVPAPGHKSDGVLDAEFLASLPPEQFAAYINSLE